MTTVRQDLEAALTRLIDIHENPTHYPVDIQPSAYKEAITVRDRARAEPEGHCKSTGYLLPCDTSCPCYQEGLEAQRERVGGGRA